MQKKKTNQVFLVGEVVEKAVYSHKVNKKQFYSTKIKVVRRSGIEDVIPLLIPKSLCNVEELFGQRLRITGSYRSYNDYYDGQKRHLILSVLVDELEILDDKQKSLEENNIFLDGYICKKPVYRTTPNGSEITDLFLVVNRRYEKSDYIPCICWGIDAGIASEFEVGNRVQLRGRIQSREYNKKISETEVEIRTAYEVSISKMEVVYGN